MDKQPDSEEIEALEGVKTDKRIGAEFTGSQDNHGKNPTDYGDITENGGGPRGETVERVLRWRNSPLCGDWLTGAAFCAKPVTITGYIPAIAAIRHLLLSTGQTAGLFPYFI